jgi:murein DD-endopeptidase MepM/ murein hydrolase activator NlpD
MPFARAAFVALLFALGAFAADKPCTDAVCVDVREINDIVTLYAVSRADGTSIELSVTAENMGPRARKLTRVLKRGRTPLLTLAIDDRDKAWNYEYEYTWAWGTVGAKHDDRISYRLPFVAGERVRLYQGPYGPTTHQKKAAWDFPMLRGTPVCAARGGVVVDIVDKFDEGGNDLRFYDKANKILILHSDGTIAAYLHLLRGGMHVKVHDVVQAGTVIGEVGNSGYSSGPHLHFEVFRLIDTVKPEETLNVKFLTTDGPGVVLEAGQWYRVK